MGVTISEIIWLKGLLYELGIFKTKSVFFCDNKVAIQIAVNPIFYERSKHTKAYVISFPRIFYLRGDS